MSQLITICCLSHKPPLHAHTDSGTSPSISKCSDGGNHRVPKPRTSGEHKRWVLFHTIVKGSFPPPPQRFLNRLGLDCSRSGSCFFLLEKIFLEKLKIVSENDQEIPQSQTADNPVAPRGRAAQPSRDTRKTNKAKQPALSSPSR